MVQMENEYGVRIVGRDKSYLTVCFLFLPLRNCNCISIWPRPSPPAPRPPTHTPGATVHPGLQGGSGEPGVVG